MLDVDIDGAGELAARFDAMPAAIRAALKDKIADLADRLVDKIKNDKLGGEVLRARTGALQGSIGSSVDDDGASVSSAGVKYAFAQEYGFDGDETVAAHSPCDSGSLRQGDRAEDDFSARLFASHESARA